MSKKAEVVVKAGPKKKEEGEKENITAIVEQNAQTTAVALPAIDMFADAGMGMEGVDKESFAIPFLAVLQGLSPQCETVEGAKPGLLINTVTNALMQTALVVPVAYQRRYLRWTPREAGGGFKGEMKVSEVDALMAAGKAVRDETNGRIMFEGDVLKDTRIHFAFLLRDDGGYERVILSMAGTQVKKSKRWMSLINGIQVKAPNGAMFTPPSFSHYYSVKTVKEENDKGKWHSFDMSLGGRIEDAGLYNAAKEFHSQVTAGKVNVTPPAEDLDAEDSHEGSGKF